MSNYVGTENKYVNTTRDALHRVRWYSAGLNYWTNVPKQRDEYSKIECLNANIFTEAINLAQNNSFDKYMERSFTKIEVIYDVLQLSKAEGLCAKDEIHRHVLFAQVMFIIEVIYFDFHGNRLILTKFSCRDQCVVILSPCWIIVS